MATETSDEALILAVKNGSHAAFDQIVRRYQDHVYAYLRSVLRDSTRAEDAAQDVFLRLFRGAATYRPVEGGRFKSWLFTIAANVARTAQRTRRSVPLPEDHPVTEKRESEAEERQERVRAAIESLPEEQQEVILLKEYQGLTFEEVARALDIPVNTAKSRMRYGLLKLSELLQGYMK